MSAHFSILREADLIDSSKQGKTVLYCLKLSVLEEALAGFVGLLGIQVKAAPRDQHAETAFSNAKESHENDF
jgi:DNA-binding transcriptional ArsR family regulator